MNRSGPALFLTTLALLALAACGQAASPTAVPAASATATPTAAGRATRTASPAKAATATVVWPTLQEVSPARPMPGQQVRVSGSGGYLREPSGAYNESNRTFALTFDGQPIGTIACYANRCEGSVLIPAQAAPGAHQLSVEGGSSLAVQVVTGP